ncbi:MAG: flagellar biosynthetic protein FliO [Chromatiales bacterium]|nr:flagellar biosynthetic protein FliO [Gammaproteobacteria bacterium]MCP5352796.1 flagellar biosynthetic protein FliO [Chromatiales bacterium]
MKHPQHLIARASVTAGLGLLASSAWAAEAVNGAASLAKVLIVLMLIIGLIFGAGWFLRRYGLPGQNRQTGMLQTLDTLHLGARERIVLLGVGEQRIVIGVSGTQMNALGQFHADDIGDIPTVTEPAPAAPPAAAERVKFADALRASLTRQLPGLKG